MPRQRLPQVSLHFDVFGDVTDPPLLLLHGLGSSGEDWRQVAPSLSGFRVVVPDVRGHGRSDKPAGAYGVPLFASDLAAFCDAQGISNAHVVGLSMGGMIALQLAVDRPDLVKSLVVVNSGPALIPKGLAQWATIAVRFFLTIVFGPARLAPIVAKKLFPHDDQQALRDEITARIAANDPSAYRRASTGILGWSVLDRLSSVTMPVLALSGDRDYTPVDD
ncbi:MAG TPA: alpha/beta hydrolase, partial [Myxococcota bacterium]